MQTDLLKTAHQLIAIANQLILAAAGTTEAATLVAATNVEEIVEHQHTYTPLAPATLDYAAVDRARPEKVAELTAKAEYYKSILKNPNSKQFDIKNAKVMLSVYKGHLTKALSTKNSAGAKWKSRV